MLTPIVQRYQTVIKSLLYRDLVPTGGMLLNQDMITMICLSSSIEFQLEVETLQKIFYIKSFKILVHLNIPWVQEYKFV